MAHPKVDLTDLQQRAIDALARDEAVIPAPVWLAREANLANDTLERRFAAEDPDAFWREQARLVDWIERLPV